MQKRGQNMYHIVFDLEMNCWGTPILQNKKGNFVYDRNKKLYLQSTIQEVIEIGAVKLNKDLNIIETFQTFVKPTFNPYITKFCTNLTGISQNDIEFERGFKKCINQFYNWITESETFNLYSWSNNDKIQILKECKEKHINSPIETILDKKFIDLQEQYTLLCGKTKNDFIGLKNAAIMLGIPFEQHHRALEDSLVAADILLEMLGTWQDKIMDIK